MRSEKLSAKSKHKKPAKKLGLKKSQVKSQPKQKKPAKHATLKATKTTRARIAHNESEPLPLPESKPEPENEPTTVPSAEIARCRFMHHIGTDGKPSLQKPVEKCTACGARKVCGAFVGHVCLHCQPENSVKCGMCQRAMYDCTC